MKKVKKKLVLVSILLFISLMLNSCTTLGPLYQKVDTVPDDKGLVYIYRPKKLVGGGVKYKVKVGDTPITILHNGGYYPYFSEPGEVEFWAKTESRSSVTLDMKPGQTHYIKGTVGVGFLLGRPHLLIVSPDVAEQEILECKLIPEQK